MISLGSLPARSSETADIDRATYNVALDGVTRHGLTQAVVSILKGKLGHTFFPSPVELRHACDAAMEPHVREAERIQRRNQNSKENADYERVIAARTPEGRARVKATYDAFCSAYKDDKAQQASHEVRGRYGMTDDRMADVPDRGNLPDNWKQPKTG